MSRKTYTPFGKWYGIISLGLLPFFYSPLSTALRITFFYSLYLLASANRAADRALVGALVGHSLFILWTGIIILGIATERAWARWLAVATYSFTALIGLAPSLIILTDATTAGLAWGVLTWLALILPNLLFKVVIPVLGIIVILKQPKTT
jgi:hypothetical protein